MKIVLFHKVWNQFIMAKNMEKNINVNITFIRIDKIRF